LITYDDAFNNSGSILAAITEGFMPPWPADPGYRHFANENVLSTEEKNLIEQWVMGGAIEGNSANAPMPPSYNSNSAIPEIDFTANTPLNASQAVSQDDYRTFVIPSNFTTDQFIDAIEIIPGNNDIVHHVVIYYDPTNTCLSYDAADPQPGFATNGTGGGIPTAAHFMAAWVPGKGPQFLPQGFGLRAEANGYFLIEMHYPAGSAGQTDETTINLHFSNDSNPREVFFEPVITHSPSTLDEPALVIPANTVATFHATYHLNNHVTVLGVFPHMHLIGKSITSFAVNGNDTVPLIHVPQWDFEWQFSYDYPQLIQLTPGTDIKAVATYDNTLNNPNQPNNPPQLVMAGEETADEMLIVFFMYTAYQPGDENIIIDSNLFIHSSQPLKAAPLALYPNPANNEIHWKGNYQKNEVAQLSILDATGRIADIIPITLRSGNDQYHYNSSLLNPGVYELSLKTTQGIFKSKFIKSN
jgi:hypothetical protein